MIEARGLTKRFGSRLAVDALSFDVRPGRVTGFLGPNGSGKSTTMRLILGLDHPDAGHAAIGGRRYRDLSWPLREAGALLEARAWHPGRTVFVSSHLISEMALMAEHIVVIGQGRLLADAPVADLASRAPSLEDAFLQLTGASTEYRAEGA